MCQRSVSSLSGILTLLLYVLVHLFLKFCFSCSCVVVSLIANHIFYHPHSSLQWALLHPGTDLCSLVMQAWPWPKGGFMSLWPGILGWTCLTSQCKLGLNSGALLYFLGLPRGLCNCCPYPAWKCTLILFCFLFFCFLPNQFLCIIMLWLVNWMQTWHGLALWLEA